MTTHDDAMPAELAHVSQRLDALAQHDAAGAPGLETRVFDSSRSALTGAAPAGVLARIGLSRLRAAAAIAVLITGSIIGAVSLRALRPAGPGPVAFGEAVWDDAALLDGATQAVAISAVESGAVGTLYTEMQSFSADPSAGWGSVEQISAEDM